MEHVLCRLGCIIVGFDEDPIGAIRPWELSRIVAQQRVHIVSGLRGVEAPQANQVVGDVGMAWVSTREPLVEIEDIPTTKIILPLDTLALYLWMSKIEACGERTKTYVNAYVFGATVDQLPVQRRHIMPPVYPSGRISSYLLRYPNATKLSYD